MVSKKCELVNRWKTWKTKEHVLCSARPIKPQVANMCICGEPYEEDSAFCTSCGERRPQSPARSHLRSPVMTATSARSPRVCGQCNRLIADDSNFCSMCGTPCEGQAPAIGTSPRRLDQSRIRTCRPVSAEMQTATVPASGTGTPVPVTVTRRIGPTPVPCVRSQWVRLSYFCILQRLANDSSEKKQSIKQIVRIAFQLCACVPSRHQRTFDSKLTYWVSFPKSKIFLSLLDLLWEKTCASAGYLTLMLP